MKNINKNDVVIEIDIQKNTSTNYMYNANKFLRTKIKSNILKNIKVINKATINNSYEIIYFYNSRVDADNNSAMIKVILDFCRKQNYIINDSPKYFKKLTIEYENTLIKNKAILIIKCL